MFVGLTFEVDAREYKVMGGFSLSRYDASGRFATDYGYRPGFGFGMGVEFPVSRLFALEADIMYVQKGNDFSEWRDGALLERTVFKLEEISLPLLLKFRLRRGTSPFIASGIELAYVLSHVAEPRADSTGPAGNEENLRDITKSFDAAIVFGAGLELAARAAALSLEVRYHWGVWNILSESYSGFSRSKPNALVMLLGVRF
ncbi:MAG: porin family protein [Candidatus Aminicenantales bacterium]